jgi:RNA polymerase sigma-70 factor, ECF subfamily
MHDEMRTMMRRDERPMVEAETRVDEADPKAACADGALLLSHLGGDETAFPRLVRAWAGPIYGYLARAGVAASEREDLFQDVFVKVHRAASEFDPRRPFKPWLFAVAVNTVRNHVRDRARRPGPPLEVVTESEADPGPSAQSVLEARETARLLERQLAQLPLAQREVLVLCCIERLPQADVAHALDIPVNTVKTHLRRARMAMAHALAGHRRRVEREVPE